MEKDYAKAGPFLKWAGGKTQLLDELMKHLPRRYKTYIEPFLGGGALFFHLQPKKAVLGDLNPELINLYEIVRDNVHALIKILRKYPAVEKFYYDLRGQSPADLTKIERAARILYLNKTCYNGLYRVNKSGEFNVPFGYRKNPVICDEPRLMFAHQAILHADLVCADYKTTLSECTHRNDLVFLDPPYYPVGGHADFKRYTREFFYEDDHIELRDQFKALINKGCNVLLTNSNTEPIRKLYSEFDSHKVDTLRNISSNARTRKGQDLIIIGTKTNGEKPFTKHGDLLEHFPGTRYMGSKYRVLSHIWDAVKDIKFNSVLDAFSGSTCVSYMFKQYDKKVISNDFLNFSYQYAKALIENNSAQITPREVSFLTGKKKSSSKFIQTQFAGLYFTGEENAFLDDVRGRIDQLKDPYKKSLALSALVRACLKKRPRGVFTFVGDRYNDGRRDMNIGLRSHFIENLAAFNLAVFDNQKKNLAFCTDIFELDVEADMVYLDPPYVTRHSDNDYVRRYHFVEGLVRKWEGLDIQTHTKTKKFKSYSSRFDTKRTIHQAFISLFEKYKNSVIVLSYSSNSIPSKDELISMLKEYKKTVKVVEVRLTYSFGNQGARVGDNANRAEEYIFVAK